ncbi:MAG: TrbI/VirB10 family protein [Acidobacteriia bacterium]|nr:TrbI/VirB10 family protein [Terriglobia bacterium]
MKRQLWSSAVAFMFGMWMLSGIALAGPDHDRDRDRWMIPEGTTLRASLETTLSTRTARQGDRFTATLREPIYVEGRQVIPYGSTIEGRVSEVQRPGRVHGVGKMDIAYERIILPNGDSEPLVASTRGTEGPKGTKVNEEGTINGPSSRKRDVEETAVAGGVGAGIGAIAGGAKGTAIGGGAGAIIGLADSMRRRGKDLELPAGTTLVIQLERPLEVHPGR